jgi:hypothetical protein
MRTKTLALTAALVAAGIASSMAQSNVYSLNVVGYVNLSLTSGQLIQSAAQLDADGTGTNNTILSQLGTNVPTSSQVYVYNPANNSGAGGYDILSYAPLTKNGTPVWQSSGTNASTYPLNPGEGFFILPKTSATVTLVGNVLQGNLTNQYVLGAKQLVEVSSKVPVAGGITTVLGYQPNNGDIAYVYNPADNAGKGGYDIYSFAPLTKNGTPVWQIGGVAGEPQIAVGQSFFLLPKLATTWVVNFTVQ